MLKVPLVIVLAVLVASCSGRQSADASAQFPLGAYKIRSAQVDYYANGIYKIFDAKEVYVLGRYQLDENVITMTDVGGQYGCKGDTNPAKYNWSFDGKSVKFSLIEDRCEARRTAMLESPFPRLAR